MLTVNKKYQTCITLNSFEYNEKEGKTSNPIYDTKMMGFHKRLTKTKYIKEIYNRYINDQMGG